MKLCYQIMLFTRQNSHPYLERLHKPEKMWKLTYSNIALLTYQLPVKSWILSVYAAVIHYCRITKLGLIKQWKDKSNKFQEHLLHQDGKNTLKPAMSHWHTATEVSVWIRHGSLTINFILPSIQKCSWMNNCISWIVYARGQ